MNKLQSTDKILQTSAMALGTPQQMTGNFESDVVTPQLFNVEQIKPEPIPAGESDDAVCV